MSGYTNINFLACAEANINDYVSQQKIKNEQQKQIKTVKRTLEDSCDLTFEDTSKCLKSRDYCCFIFTTTRAGNTDFINLRVQTYIHTHVVHIKIHNF